MTILVYGKTGQVATELAQLDDEPCVGRDSVDLTDVDKIGRQIGEMKPKAVINAAAYTAVDQVETEEDLARVVNADAPAAMAISCKNLGIPFVHISMDYVSDGSGEQPWKPDDVRAPQNTYGRTKMAGEDAVMATGGTFAILRTSWVFSAHGSNFLKTMLRLGKDRDALNIVADQIGGPTPVGAIAKACHTMATHLMEHPQKSGPYHFAGVPECSWAEFATAIFEESWLDCTVFGISSVDYPTRAARPLNSRMDCSSLKDRFGIERPDWRHATQDIIKTLEQS